MIRFSASQRTICPRAILHRTPFSTTRSPARSPKTQVTKRTEGGRWGFTALAYSREARLSTQSVSAAN